MNFYFCLLFFWIGAISAEEEDFFVSCFYNVLLLLLFHFYLACEQLLVNRRVCVCVFVFFCVSKCHFLYEIVFFPPFYQDGSS